MQLVVLMKQVLLKKLDKNVVMATLYATCEDKRSYYLVGSSFSELYCMNFHYP
jgi:hypothetical protein